VFQMKIQTCGKWAEEVVYSFRDDERRQLAGFRASPSVQVTLVRKHRIRRNQQQRRDLRDHTVGVREVTCTRPPNLSRHSAHERCIEPALQFAIHFADIATKTTIRYRMTQPIGSI